MCVSVGLLPESRKLDVVHDRPEFCDTHERRSYQSVCGIDYGRSSCPVSVNTGFGRPFSVGRFQTYGVPELWTTFCAGRFQRASLWTRGGYVRGSSRYSSSHALLVRLHRSCILQGTRACRISHNGKFLGVGVPFTAFRTAKGRSFPILKSLRDRTLIG
jgi:hypothetical protein